MTATLKTGIVQEPSSSIANLTLSSSGGVTFGAAATTNTITSAASTALTIQSAGTTAMTIDTSQNVGIGTTSPSTYGPFVVSNAQNAGIFGVSSNTGGYSYLQLLNTGTSGRSWQLATGGSSSAYAGALAFYDATASSERMRIDSSGNLLVGTTTANGKFSLVQAANGAVLYVQNSLSSGFTGPMIFSNSVSAASTNWYHLYGVSSGNTVLNIAIYGNGNIVNANNSYGAISDVSLKENIVDATPKLSDLMQVKIRNYNLKSDEDKTKQIGVVAQELETVFPAMIETNKDGIKGVKYSVFVPMLIKAIQELKAEFDAYKAAHP